LSRGILHLPDGNYFCGKENDTHGHTIREEKKLVVRVKGKTKHSHAVVFGNSSIDLSIINIF
jgi:hypothetical protein